MMVMEERCRDDGEFRFESGELMLGFVVELGSIEAGR